MIQSYYGIFPYTLPDDTELEIEYTVVYDPGVRSGPPEICYPEEGELTILSITQNGKPFEGIISDEEQDKIEGKCWEDADHKDWGRNDPNTSDESDEVIW
jgi:hypothetical protein